MGGMGQDRSVPDQPIRLTGSVQIEPGIDPLYNALGQAVVEAATGAVERRGVFHIALSGGGTPKGFYSLLASDPRYSSAIPWSQTHLWVVDERRVPETDDRNNFRMIRSTLVDCVYGSPIPTDRVHAVIDAGDDALVRDATYNFADRYEHRLRGVFNNSDDTIPRLDFVLLGMGDDAHTASLFPGTAALRVTDRLIVNNTVPPGTQPNVGRITMAYPLLNASRHVAVLVTGAKKTATLQRVDQQLRAGGPDLENQPITGIGPTDGTLTWYLDAAAAGQ